MAVFWRDVPTSTVQGVILAALAVALLSAGIGLAFVPGPSSNGIPTYPLFTGKGWSIFIEGLVALSAAFFAIAFSSVSRHGTLITLTLGVSATFVGGFVFVLTLFYYTIPVHLSDGTTIQLQRYPQLIFVPIWGLIMLLFVPVSYMISKRARADTGPASENE